MLYRFGQCPINSDSAIIKLIECKLIVIDAGFLAQFITQKRICQFFSWTVTLRASILTTVAGTLQLWLWLVLDDESEFKIHSDAQVEEMSFPLTISVIIKKDNSVYILVACSRRLLSRSVSTQANQDALRVALRRRTNTCYELWRMSVLPVRAVIKALPSQHASKLRVVTHCV